MAIIHPSSATPDSSGPRYLRSFRRPFLVARWIAVVVIFPILLGAAIVALLVDSSRGHTYLITLIQQKATQSLGVPVHLQNLDLHLATLSIDLYGLTINGAGPHSNSPLLQVQHAEAGVRVVSVLRTLMVLRQHPHR